MNNIAMIIGLIILLGIALFYNITLSLRAGESMVVAVASIIVLMTFGGFINHYQLGMIGTYLLAGAGILSCTAVRYGKKWRIGRSGQIEFFRQPVVVAFIFLYLIGMILFQQGQIHIFDEMHHWAAAIRYMFEHNTSHFQQDFMGYNSKQFYGVTLFCVFFQELGGFSEPAMYLGVFILCAVGLLLPLSSMQEGQLKYLFLYLLTIYIAFYSLYAYGIYNIYIDLPTATWTGGLAGWWYAREKQKKNLLLILAVLGNIFFFKIMVGAVMVCSLILLFILETLMDYGNKIEEERNHKKEDQEPILKRLCILFNQKRNYIMLGALAALIVIISYECMVSRSIFRKILLNQGDAAYVASKVNLTVKAFIRAILITPFSIMSEQKISYGLCILLLVIAYLILGKFCEKEKKTFDIVYMICISVGYSLVLLVAYLLLFSYEEAIAVFCIDRYLSIPIIFFVILFLSRLYQFVSRMDTERKSIGEKEKNADGGIARSRVAWVMSLLILMYFVLGVDHQFIPLMTALYNEGTFEQDIRDQIVKQYEDMVKEKIGSDKVYMIDQSAEESAACIVLYRYEDHVNHYTDNPWAFREHGAYIFNAERPSATIKDLPSYLKGYPYLWIYQSDSYLNQAIYEILEDENSVELSSGQLYRILSNDGKKISIELVDQYKN